LFYWIILLRATAGTAVYCCSAY